VDLLTRLLSRPRSFKLLGWTTLPVFALAAVVQLSGTGIDVLVVAVAGLLLFAAERSLGDWLGEWVGPLAAAAIFVVLAAALSWYFLSASLGRAQTDRFFVEAERHGYRTAYYQTPRGSADASAATAGGSRSSATATTGRGAAAASPGAERAGAAGSGTDTPRAESEGDGREGERRRDGSILSLFRRRSGPAERIATEISLSVNPARVQAARRAAIRAVVRAADGRAVTGTVEFTVNGLGAGRVALDGSGAATTTYTTHITGEYEVRARFAGSPAHAPSRSGPVVFTVVRGG